MYKNKSKLWNKWISLIIREALSYYIAKNNLFLQFSLSYFQEGLSALLFMTSLYLLRA